MKNDTDDISTSGFIQNSEYKVSGHFTEYSEIAAKGYCRLFKAQRQGQWFVLKALKPEFANDPVYQGLFDKESNLMMQLNHPNIVRIYGIEEDEVAGRCMVMEYVDGRTLDEFLTENPSQNVRKEVAQQLLDAIGYCHSKQITHRDLKPSNILVTHNGNHVKLIDFGLSDSDSYAVLKDPAYTKAYAAPEQLAGEQVDCRTDLYACGLLLKQLFPHRYGGIVRKCMQVQKEKRYVSAAEVAAAMSKYDLIRKRTPWSLPVLLAIVVFALFLLWLWQHPKTTVNAEAGSSPASDTVFLIKNNSEESFKQANGPSAPSLAETPESLIFHEPVTGKTDTAAFAAKARHTDSILYARNQKSLQEQDALDNAIYNFKFTVDSCFKPVDQYIKSNSTKCSNIFHNLLDIAENKARIRECQIRYQLPVSKRNSFFNYAKDFIQKKKASYKQDYPRLEVYPNEAGFRDEQTRQLWEESQRYSKEAHLLYQEWEKLMRKTNVGN